MPDYRKPDHRTFFRKHLDWHTACELAATRDRSEIDCGPEEDRYEWQGGNYADVMAMATGGGYSLAIPAVDEIVKNIDTDLGEALTPNFDWQFEVAGSDVDMGRFLGGEPENMINAIPLKVMRTGRIISLYVPGNVMADITADQLINRGAACVALADAFAKVQHPMEIWSSLVNTEGQVRAAILVKVQEATAPLDMGRIMFALAHPGFPRQMGFALKEWAGNEPDFCLKNGRNMRADLGWWREEGNGNGGYGSGYRHIQDDDVVGDAEHTIILPELTERDARNFEDPKWVEKWIMAQLERVRG